MSLELTIARTQADSANGHTGFALQLGYMSWDIELHELADLFNEAPAIQLGELLRLKPGEMRQICVIARLEKQA